MDAITYLLVFAVSFVIVTLLIPPLRRLAYRIDFLDKPQTDNGRKLHREPIPLTASIAIFIGFVVTYLIFVKPLSGQTLAVLAGGLLILIIGIVDDWHKTHKKDFPALPKFIVQLAAAAIVYQSGIVFDGFTNPLTGSTVMLPTIVQFVLTVMWIFGVTTVINFSDGLDGLAGGLSAISAGTLFVVALAKGQSGSAIMAMIIIGVALAYFRFNKPPAKVFMGDAGATFLGFMLGVIALDGAFKQATLLSLLIPILAIGVPIFDNLLVVARRIRAGRPIYVADGTQVHHRLHAIGLNPKQIVAFLCLMNASFGLMAIIILLLTVH